MSKVKLYISEAYADESMFFKRLTYRAMGRYAHLPPPPPPPPPHFVLPVCFIYLQHILFDMCISLMAASTFRLYNLFISACGWPVVCCMLHYSTPISAMRLPVRALHQQEAEHGRVHGCSIPIASGRCEIGSARHRKVGDIIMLPCMAANKLQQW